MGWDWIYCYRVWPSELLKISDLFEFEFELIYYNFLVYLPRIPLTFALDNTGLIKKYIFSYSGNIFTNNAH